MNWADGVLHFRDDEPAVCVTHQRFIPCRFRGSHTFSTALDDVRSVQKYMDDYKREQDEK